MCESDLNTWLANYYEFSSYTSSMQSIWCSFRHLILMSCWVQYYCSYPMIRGSGVAHIHTYQQHILHMRTMRISTFESGRKEDIKFLLYYGFDCNPTATLFNWFFKYFNFFILLSSVFVVSFFFDSFVCNFVYAFVRFCCAPFLCRHNTHKVIDDRATWASNTSTTLLLPLIVVVSARIRKFVNIFIAFSFQVFFVQYFVVIRLDIFTRISQDDSDKLICILFWYFLMFT